MKKQKKRKERIIDQAGFKVIHLLSDLEVAY
jgi:hypothetical protein